MKGQNHAFMNRKLQKKKTDFRRDTSSLYKNLDEDKQKYADILAKMEQKRVLVKQSKQKSRESQWPISTKPKTEQDNYIQQLIECKPWLKFIGLKGWKLDKLMENFPLCEPNHSEAFSAEVEFIKNKVYPKLDIPKSKKSLD